MTVYVQIYRSALNDALVRNLDDQPCEDLPPIECARKRWPPREVPEGKVEAARMHDRRHPASVR